MLYLQVALLHSLLLVRSQIRIVLSVAPLISLFSYRCRHLTIPLCPSSVKQASSELVRMSHTLIMFVDPLTIRVSSNCIQDTASSCSCIFCVENVRTENLPLCQLRFNLYLSLNCLCQSICF